VPAVLFIAPNFVFFVAFMAIPILWLVPESFETGGVISPSRWVGTYNWTSVFSDPTVANSIRNTVIYVAFAVPAVFAIAFVVALLLSRVERGSRAFRTAIYVPTLAPMVLLALTWVFVVHFDFGLLNMVLTGVGFQPVNWLGGTHTPMLSVIMLEVWRGVGFWSLFFLAALLGLPRDQIHAAMLDGASVLQRIRHIVIPALRPTLIFAVTIAIALNLQVFDSVYVLTGGGPLGRTQTVVWYIYQSIFFYSRPGFGAALSLVLLGIIFVLTGLIWWLLFHRGLRRRAA
jgi:ABC-type sugar transport system permease subunit